MCVIVGFVDCCDQCSYVCYVMYCGLFGGQVDVGLVDVWYGQQCVFDMVYVGSVGYFFDCQFGGSCRYVIVYLFYCLDKCCVIYWV